MATNTADSRIPVGISACLLGQEVRHDGGHKHSRYCTDILSRYFAFRPLCPEVEAGLGVPRKAMHLVDQEGQVRLWTTKGQEDHSAAMHQAVERSLGPLAPLRGYILMAKSPSCGLERVRVYRPDGELRHRAGKGLFARALQVRYPLMPVEEAGRLNDDALRENFVERVYLYDDWCNLKAAGLTAQRLIAFHSRHKFQLLAHCQRTYRELGPMLADLKSVDLEAVAGRYISAFMQAMKKQVSRGAHVNTLQHLAGFLRGELDATDRTLIHEQIEAYMRGDVPLIVPLTLLRGALRKADQPYLAHQQYLAPYPDDLGLRNRL